MTRRVIFTGHSPATIFNLSVLSEHLNQRGGQLKLINDLDAEDKAMVFRLIDTVVTKKKFKDFVASVQ